MTFNLGQVVETTQAASQVLAGRSEPLLVVVIGMALIAFVLWRDTKKQEKDDARLDRREESERARNERDSGSLKLISESTERSAEGIELMAKTVEKMEHRQERDRRAILSIIESVDAKNAGDEGKANNSLRDARTILLSGD